MGERKKITFLSIALSLLLILGVSFAFFNYQRISNKNVTLIAGEIYLHLNDGTNSITVNKSFPMTKEQARARDDNVLTFTIDGKNTTTNKDIWYEIDLVEGDPIDGKVRLDPKFVKYDLIEIENSVETMVVDAESFPDLNSRKIHVNTVNRNTTQEIVRTYKLRVWVSRDDILISDTDSNADYTTSEYKNTYLSLKVKVQGDFNERKMATPASCFTTSPAEYSYVRNPNMDLSACVSFFTTYFDIENNPLNEGETLEAFCNGTGTVRGETFENGLKNNWFDNDALTDLENEGIIIEDYTTTITDYDENCGSDVIVPSTINAEFVTGYTRNPNMDVSTCVNKFTELGWNVDTKNGETLEAFCNGTGTSWGDTFQEVLDVGDFSPEEFAELESAGIIVANTKTVKAKVMGLSGLKNKNIETIQVPNSIYSIGHICVSGVVKEGVNIYNEDGSNSCVASIPTIESCPGCKFMYTTSINYTTWNMAGWDDINQLEVAETPTQITIGLYDNYVELMEITGKDYFLGVKLNSNNEVTNAYACGVKDDVPFCLEGTSDGSKYTANQTLLQGANLYENTCIIQTQNAGQTNEYEDISCGPWDNFGSVSASADSNGNVNAGVGDDSCGVLLDGAFGCGTAITIPDPGTPDPGGGQISV